MNLLSFDPGDSTGWSWWEKSQLTQQGTILNGVDGFVDWARSQPPWKNFTIIYEDFIMDGTTRGRCWSAEVIGAIRMWRPDTPMVVQSRSNKADLFNQKHKGDRGQTERNEWLRVRGFGGTQHELDAIAHALRYLKAERDPVAIKQYWG